MKFSVVGNAVLFVILLGGSHPMPNNAESGQIYPHKPVHLARGLSARLDMDPYLAEIHDAQQAWDDAVGGDDIIINQGPVTSGLAFDAIVVDGDHGTPMSVSLKAHNGQEAIFAFNAGDGVQLPCEHPEVPGDCWNAYTLNMSADISPVDQAMKIVVLRTDFYVAFFEPSARWRNTTHEFGHVLGLDDHFEIPCDPVLGGNGYDGMMDANCRDHQADFQIWNLQHPALFLIADEASCVRELFDLPGKQRCAALP